MLRLAAELPADLAPGAYTVYVHNGFGGNSAWRKAGTPARRTPAPWPTKTFNVLDTYGKDAVQEMRKTLSKYSPVPDRTEGIHAALKKAKDNGGGIVYFPAGRYGIQGDLDVPPRTVLKGEGMGLVVLWWGTGRFNLDGGSDEGLEADKETAKVPPTLIHGSEFGLEEMSLYLPLAYQTAISGGERFCMRKVRVRIDHYWAIDGRKRPEGVVAYLGNHAEVTDCDILAKGTALVPREYCLIARNRIMAGKTNCTLGGSRQVIVEDNHLVSLYPTAYENIAGSGRNLYYARNRQEAFHVHQADYSFTFDAGDAAYFGKIAATRGRQLTLAEDPSYPELGAGEKRLVAEGRRLHPERPGGRPMAERRLQPGAAMGDRPRIRLPARRHVAGDDRAHERPRAGGGEPLRGRELGQCVLRHGDRRGLCREPPLPLRPIAQLWLSTGQCLPAFLVRAVPRQRAARGPNFDRHGGLGAGSRKRFPARLRVARSTAGIFWAKTTAATLPFPATPAT